MAAMVDEAYEQAWAQWTELELDQEQQDEVAVEDSLAAETVSDEGSAELLVLEDSVQVEKKHENSSGLT